MKKLSFFIVTLFLFFQCQNEKISTIPATSSLEVQSIKTIKYDKDFIDFVDLTGRYTKLIYTRRGKLYDKKDVKNPFHKIEESRERIKENLSGELTKIKLNQIFNEYNVTEKEVSDLTGRILIRIGRLNQKFGDDALSRLTKEEFYAAFDYAQKVVNSYDQSKARPGDYCVQCPFANCENCLPGQNFDEPEGDRDGDGIPNWMDEDDGYGGYDKCATVRQNAARKRDNTISNAWREYAVEALGCAGSAVKAAESLYGATWYLNALGPEAPFAVAALGSVGVGASCMWLATGRLDSNIQIAESDYRLDVMGQNCNP
jgi:hypothetical protein